MLLTTTWYSSLKTVRAREIYTLDTCAKMFLLKTNTDKLYILPGAQGKNA